MDPLLKQALKRFNGDEAKAVAYVKRKRQAASQASQLAWKRRKAEGA